MKVYTWEMGNIRGNAVRIAADINKIDHKMINTTAADCEKKEHLARNPLGQIPVVEVKEGYIYQTNAILRYIASIGEKKLYGKTDFEKAKIDQWLDYFQTEFLQFVVPLLLASVGKCNLNKEQLAEAEKELGYRLEFLELSLKDKKFFVGDQFSIADICYMVFLVYVFRCHWTEEYRKKIPNLTRIYENVAAQPQFIKYFGKTYTPKQSWIL